MNVTIISLWAQKLFRPDEPQPFGGAELQLALLAEALSEIPNVTVRFITRGRGPAESFKHDRIHVHKLPYRTQRLTRGMLGLWDCLRACMLLPTDVFIQRGGGFETGVAGRASRSTKKPFLFMTSSTWDVDGTHENNRGFLYGKAYMYGLKQSSAIVTQTEYQRELLLQRYFKESVVLKSSHSIPNEIPNDKQGVLWVGRCEPCKNPERFLELAAQIPNVPCTMVCPPANLTDMFESLKTKAASIPNLKFVPGVPFEETENLFSKHRIMVNTSTQEGYPNTYVQSFKWGVPIVSEQFDPDGILESHNMGFKTGDDLERLTHRVNELLKDDSLWNKYSLNARRFAIENHDVKVNAQRLYDLLHKIVSRSAT